MSLIEVIIAVSFFSLVAVSLFHLLGGTYLGFKSAASNQKALFYAEEGAEAVRSIRNQAWNNIEAGSYGLSKTSNQWQLNGGEETLDNFYTRKIIIEDVYRDNSGNFAPPASPGAILDLHTKKVISLVSWPVPGGAIRQIDLPFFVSSWQTKSWIQTDWQAGSGQLVWSNPAQFFSDDGNIDYSVNGEIKLKQNGALDTTASFGNRFLVDSLNTSLKLDAETKKASFRFTAQQTKSVNQIRVYIHARSSNPPIYRFGLQADNGNGNPSGIYFGYGDISPGSSGWLTITLNQSVSLAQGQTYHLVIQWQSGTIKSNRYIVLRQTSPLNNLIPLDQVPDPQANVLSSSDGGTTWQTFDSQPLYQMTFQDNGSEGNPYENFAEMPVYRNFFQGQNLTLAEDKEFSEISFYVRRFGNQQPLDNLYFTIDNLTDNVRIINGVLAAPSAVGATYSWQTYQFPERVNLEKNKSYRLYLSSPGARASRYYLILAPVASDQAYFKAITFLGESGFGEQSSDSGASWQIAEERDLNFYFGLISPTYSPQGELISSAFNTGALAAFDFLSWLEIIPSPNTDIWVQLATAPDNAGAPGEWGQWQGPSGPDSYYQSGEEQLIPAANNHNDSQFVRYKVILRSDGSDTPAFQEIKINYTP